MMLYRYRTPLTVSAILMLLRVAIFCQESAGLPLERELIDKSHHGLALATVWSQGPPELNIRFFDGRTETRQIECCAFSYTRISRGRITSIQRAGTFNDHGLSGGHVIVMDLSGKTIAKSRLMIHASLVSVSPDGKRYAFLGLPVEPEFTTASYGLHIAEMDSAASRPLRVLEVSGKPSDADKPPPSVDWTGDGNLVLFSDGTEIFMIDVRTGVSRTIAKGCNARQSPTRNEIVYMSQGTIALLNLTTGKTTPILANREILRPPTWSPDGKYLAFVERHYSIYPCISYGQLDVYRVSDGAVFPIKCFGIVGPEAQWIQL